MEVKFGLLTLKPGLKPSPSATPRPVLRQLQQKWLVGKPRNRLLEPLEAVTEMIVPDRWTPEKTG